MTAGGSKAAPALAGQPGTDLNVSATLAAELGALRVGPDLLAAGNPRGTLAGVPMVVKDLIDVAGVATGAGNPTYLAGTAAGSEHAPAVERLLRAGVSVVGKSHTDELAFSLSGTNVHYGTPRNPAAPGRVPGGSSSGSVSAVAGGLVPLAMGTDTGGSIRVPASYCGVFGLRPTYGRVPLTGVVELAASFGTVGLLAASGPLLAAAGLALLGEPEPAGGPLAAAGGRPADGGPGSHAGGAPADLPSALVVADDLMAEADPVVAKAVIDAAEALAGDLGVPLRRTTVAGGELDGWFAAFRGRQMVEAWRRHGPWIERCRPDLGPGIAARFTDASRLPADAADAAGPAGRAVRCHIDRALPEGAVLVLPSAATVAPTADLDGPHKADLRQRTLRLTCLAGLGGLPAVSLPLARAGGLPAGVCLVGRAGQDRLLLAVAARCGDPQVASTRDRMDSRRWCTSFDTAGPSTATRRPSSLTRRPPT